MDRCAFVQAWETEFTMRAPPRGRSCNKEEVENSTAEAKAKNLAELGLAVTRAQLW